MFLGLGVDQVVELPAEKCPEHTAPSVDQKDDQDYPEYRSNCRPKQYGEHVLIEYEQVCN